MLARFFAERALKAFAQRYNYDVSYMRYMLDVAPAAFFKFAPMSKLAAHRGVAPAEAVFAVKITGALAEDCGPCSQLAIDMARSAGVDDAQITAIVQQDIGAMHAATALAYHFATAVLERTADMTARREAIRTAWGDRAVVELTLALQVGRLFPMIKAGLGYDQACQQLAVGEQQLRFRSTAA